MLYGPSYIDFLRLRSSSIATWAQMKCQQKRGNLGIPSNFITNWVSSLGRPVKISDPRFVQNALVRLKSHRYILIKMSNENYLSVAM